MNRSAQELEREVEASRAGVEDTIDAIRERLSVGQMVDEGLRYMKQSGGAEFAQRLGDQVKSNPLPLVLVGVGLAWLMSGRGQPHLPQEDSWDHHASTDQRFGGRRYDEDYGDAYGEAGLDGAGTRGYPEDRATDFYSGGDGYQAGSLPRSGYATGSVGTSTGEESSEENGESLTDRAGAAVEWAGDQVGSLRHAGRDAFVRARRRSGGAYRGATRYAGGAYSGIQRSISDVLDREPLILGAIGLAVGAAIGAALPRTEIEDRLMGERAAELKDEAMHAAEEQLERAKDVTKKAYEAGREEAGSQLGV